VPNQVVVATSPSTVLSTPNLVVGSTDITTFNSNFAVNFNASFPSLSVDIGSRQVKAEGLCVGARNEGGPPYSYTLPDYVTFWIVYPSPTVPVTLTLGAVTDGRMVIIKVGAITAPNYVSLTDFIDGQTQTITLTTSYATLRLMGFLNTWFTW
jgi:hypothetical protein